MTPTAETIIIGGGVMGCSIAYNLAARGMKNIVLLERDVLGSGATGRSAATVHTHFSTATLARMAWQSLNVFRDFNGVVGGTCGFTETGHLVFAGREQTIQTNARLALLREEGIETSIINHQDTAEIVPEFLLDDCTAIAYEPLSGYADASGTALAYAARARQLGVKVQLRTTATGLEINHGKVASVITNSGRISTGRVILAAGAWSRDFLLPYGVDLPLRVTRHEIAAFQGHFDKSKRIPAVSDLINQTHFRPEGDGLVLAGVAEPQESGKPITDPAFYGHRPTPGFTETVWNRLAERIPVMRNAEYHNGFAGLYTSTPDRHPIIDQLGESSGLDGLFLCAGFSGHGFKLAPAVGVAMADLALDSSGNIDLSPFKISRFQSAPGQGQMLRFNNEANVII